MLVDVAIGAPFEAISASHFGAVYLFFGSLSGIQLTEGQRITGESLGSRTPLQGLGFAFSRRWDSDWNGFNGLCVYYFYEYSIVRDITKIRWLCQELYIL